MVLNILAPEFVVAITVGFYHHAYYARRKMKELTKLDSISWSVQHSFFVHMGGFVISNDTRQGECPARSLQTTVLDISASIEMGNRTSQENATSSGDSLAENLQYSSFHFTYPMASYVYFEKRTISRTFRNSSLSRAMAGFNATYFPTVLLLFWSNGVWHRSLSAGLQFFASPCGLWPPVFRQ